MSDEHSADTPNPLGDSENYEEIYRNIRYTDDISFKLLGLIPTLSGFGIFSIINSSKSFSQTAIIYISLFGAAVTFGLFRWELRNIDTCKWFRERSETIERSIGAAERPTAPQFLGRRMGKTQAETIIYTAIILAWLLLPLIKP